LTSPFASAFLDSAGGYLIIVNPHPIMHTLSAVVNRVCLFVLLEDAHPAKGALRSFTMCVKVKITRGQKTAFCRCRCGHRCRHRCWHFFGGF